MSVLSIVVHPEVIWVITAYGIVKLITSMARFRLIVKPTLKNVVLSAEPIPRCSFGHAFMMALMLGLLNIPLPTPNSTIYTIVTQIGRIGCDGRE